MPDNKKLTDGRDDAKVDANDRNEIAQVHAHFPSLKRADIIAAIKAAGPVRKDIYAYIKKKYRLQ